MASRIRNGLCAVALAGVAFAAAAGEITVSAAASLTNAFTEVARAFEAARPGTRILLNFGASGALLQQMDKGAPVDVFASADQETMDLAQKKGLVAAQDRQDFARNALVVIVPADGGPTIKRLNDLGQAAVKRVAVGNPASVPVGRYAKRALEAANLWPMVEAKMVGAQSVRQALDYVARGEVDAAFVYATDAAIAPDRVRIAFAVPTDVPIRYPIAALARARHRAEAARFVDFVASDAARAVLAKHGFGAP